MRALTYIACIFMPLQFLAIRIPNSTSNYDITNFIILFIGFILVLYNFKIQSKLLICLLIFLIVQIITYLYFGIAPFGRFFSASIWLSSLLILIVNGEKNVYYNSNTIFHVVITSLVLSSIYMWYEYQYLITPEGYNGFNVIFDTDFHRLRPEGPFQEPSYAALVLLSACAGLFGKVIIVQSNFQKNLIHLIMFFILMITALLCRSMHLITFAISLITFIFLWSTFKIDIKKIILILIGIGVFLFVIYYVITNAHYIQRLNIFIDPASMKNASLLSWLRGFDQALVVVNNSPLFGYGIGSTGYFEFYSPYTERLAHYRLETLTLYDAFSLFFRLTIEIGLLPIVLFLAFLFIRLLSFRNFLISYPNKSDAIYSNIVFIFIFSFTLIVGCLIKEPNYARSSLALGIFLFASVPINSYLKK